MAPWRGEESTPFPESTFTPWAHPGWLCWNEHAVEVQVADFLAALTYHHASVVGGNLLVIETGSGQGYVTRRIAKALQRSCHLWAFESDEDWNAYVGAQQWWMDNLQACLKQTETPTPNQMAQAKLVILDSNDTWRKQEIMLWKEMAPRDSLLFVHDTGSIHPPHDGHFTNGFLIKMLGLTGFWLENPRGSFLAQKGVLLPHKRYRALWDTTLEHVYSFE